MKLSILANMILATSRTYMSDPTETAGTAQAPDAPLATGAVGVTAEQKTGLFARIEAVLETAGAYVHEKIVTLLDDLGLDAEDADEPTEEADAPVAEEAPAATAVETPVAAVETPEKETPAT